MNKPKSIKIGETKEFNVLNRLNILLLQKSMILRVLISFYKIIFKKGYFLILLSYANIIHFPKNN